MKEHKLVTKLGRRCVQRPARTMGRGQVIVHVYFGLHFCTFMKHPFTALYLMSLNRHIGGSEYCRTVVTELDPMRKPVVKPPVDPAKTGDLAPPPDTKLFLKLPLIVAHVVDCHYEDGTARTPGTITFKRYGSGFTIVLKEPDACLQMMVTAPTIDEAWKAAETLLGAKDAPWEIDRYATPMKNRKK